MFFNTHMLRSMTTMLVVQFVATVAAFGTGATPNRLASAPVSSTSRTTVLAASAALPAELESPAWLPDLQACCSLVDAAGSESAQSDVRMGSVLEWLQMMLVQIELGDEDEELDDDFVTTARPWLHAKAFHDVTCKPNEFTAKLWQHVCDAKYLEPDAEGGTLLLLLPTQLPYSLFDEVVQSVRKGVQSNLNGQVAVLGCHPDATSSSEKAPVPLIRLFLDSPDLLIEGGSMGDAAGFL